LAVITLDSENGPPRKKEQGKRTRKKEELTSASDLNLLFLRSFMA